MDTTKISIDEFLASFTRLPLRAKAFCALSSLPNGKTPISAICFSNQEKSFSIFTQIVVPERWDTVKNIELQSEIYETVVLSSGCDQYDKIEIGVPFQFSPIWDGGAAIFGPVRATELWNGLEVVSTRGLKVHREMHLGKDYELLTEIVFVTSTTKWQLALFANLPPFLDLEELLPQNPVPSIGEIL